MITYSELLYNCRMIFFLCKSFKFLTLRFAWRFVLRLARTSSSAAAAAMTSDRGFTILVFGSIRASGVGYRGRGSTVGGGAAKRRGFEMQVARLVRGGGRWVGRWEETGKIGFRQWERSSWSGPRRRQGQLVRCGGMRWETGLPG